MLRLKINLRVRRSVRVKCPRHPRYNPEREGAGAIRGGCRYCLAMAIDLPGFGHSERRNELLTSSAMGEFVANVVEQFGLRRPYAVGPDTVW